MLVIHEGSNVALELPAPVAVMVFVVFSLAGLTTVPLALCEVFKNLAGHAYWSEVGVCDLHPFVMQRIQRGQESSNYGGVIVGCFLFQYCLSLHFVFRLSMLNPLESRMLSIPLACQDMEIRLVSCSFIHVVHVRISYTASILVMQPHVVTHMFTWAMQHITQRNPIRVIIVTNSNTTDKNQRYANAKTNKKEIEFFGSLGLYVW